MMEVVCLSAMPICVGNPDVASWSVSSCHLTVYVWSVMPDAMPVVDLFDWSAVVSSPISLGCDWVAPPECRSCF